MTLEIKKNKENYEVNLFHNKNSKSHYWNLITKDPQRIAQILIDLEIQGYPITKAISIFLQRMRKKDWMGI